ncbi:MAG: NfeD family protein [Anaerolineaceae bacterium]|nr:NfeD family protein [Anaerolineaceae bacterium]
MSEITWIEALYWAATIIGSTLFILRTLMMIFGGGFDDADVDLDMDGDFDFDGDLEDAHMGAADSDFSFKLLSMQGLTAFFMMFGLVGLALLKASLAIFITILGGILAGLFAVWIISLIFAQTKHLQSDGTIKIRNAIGQHGTVYLSIPENGSGQVQIPIQGSLKIFDAISKKQEKIPTGDKIHVIDVVDNKTIVVEKIQD